MADRRSSRKLKKETRSVKKSQDFLPRIDIRYGMYIVESRLGVKRYLKLMDIRPIPFYTMPLADQVRIMEAYEEWLRIAPERWGIYATTSDTNKEALIRHIREQTLYEGKNVQRACGQYVDWIRKISAKDTVSRKLYLVFEYKAEDDGIRAQTDEEIGEIMENQAQIIETNFSVMGLSRIRHKDGENRFLGDVLYRHLNRTTSKSVTFDERINMMVSDAEVLQGTEDPEVDPRNYYAPTALKTDQERYIEMDGLYHTYLYLNPLESPIRAYAGWIDRFTSHGPSVSVSITFRRMNKELTITRLRQTNRFTRSYIRQSRDVEANEERGGRLQNNEYILKSLRGGSELWETVILLSLSAPSLRELMKLKREVIKASRMDGFLLGECANRNDQAMLMMLPILYSDASIASRAGQHFLTEGVASIFPFTDFVIDDPHGAVIAVDGAGKLVALDPFDTDMHTNANGIVVGMAGSGKTYAMNTFLRHMRLMGVKIRLILPVKGKNDYFRTTESVDGQFITFVPGGESCVNLFEIRPEDDVDEGLIIGNAYEHRSLLAKKISEIRTWLALRTRQSISEDEMNEADIVLTDMYKRFGITEDNDTVREFKQRGDKYPTFSDFAKALEGNVSLERIARAIKPFTQGSCRNLDGQTNVDLENKWIAFDVDESVCGDFLPEYYYIAMSLCVSDAHRSVTDFVLLFYDEVQRVTRNRETAKYVDDQYATLRGYGAGVWCATQQVGKLAQVDNGEMSQTILSNAATKVILRTDPSETRGLGVALDLTGAEIKFIQNPAVGAGLIITGGNHTIVRFRASEEEFWLFNTDPKKAREHEAILKAAQAERDRKKEQADREELLRIAKSENTLRETGRAGR